MRKLLSIFLIFYALGQLNAQNSATVVSLEYEGEPAFASQNIETRYMGEYVHDKGKAEHQFFIKIDKEGSFMLLKNGEANSWDETNRKDIEWLFISNAEGRPLVFKMQEFSDGEMQSFPAMVFLYREVGTDSYNSKMLILRNGSLFLDDAPKQTSVAAQ